MSYVQMVIVPLLTWPNSDLSPAKCHSLWSPSPAGDMSQCPTGGHRYWSPDPMRHGHGHHPPLLTCPRCSHPWPLSSLQRPGAGPERSWRPGLHWPPVTTSGLSSLSRRSATVSRGQRQADHYRTLVTSGASWSGSSSLSSSSGQLRSSGNSS